MDTTEFGGVNALRPSVAGRGDDNPFYRAYGRCPLFCTLRGNAMSDAYIRRLLKRLAAKAGIDKRVHAHGLRHTHAAQLRAEGVDIAIISRQLGHASITTTARYLDHLAPRAVIETMRNRAWSGA
jgi:site-specific recombinase XerD